MFRKSAAICVAALVLMGFDSPQRTDARNAFDVAMAKADACVETPTHACMFGLMLDAAEALPRLEAEAAAALIEAAMLTKDESLVADVIRRVKWNNQAALRGYRIRAALHLKDREALVNHADAAIRGVRHDWYELQNLVRGLAQLGEIERARKIVDLIPHGSGDSITARNLHRSGVEAISYHDPAPATFRRWADERANSREWWVAEDDAFFEQARANLSGQPARLQEVANSIQARYRENGWQYLRGLARIAPDMSATDDAGTAAMFRGYVESWADPRNDQIAENVLAIAARAGPQTRAAMLAAFDARQASPPALIASKRRLVDTPDAALSARDTASLGLAGGSYNQKRAAELLATLSQEEILAAARAGTGAFTAGRLELMKLLIEQTDDKAFARSIAVALADLADQGVLDAYNFAMGAVVWARDNCDTALFERAATKTGNDLSGEIAAWRARVTGDPGEFSMWAALYDRRSGDDLGTGAAGYESIILDGYCPAS